MTNWTRIDSSAYRKISIKLTPTALNGRCAWRKRCSDGSITQTNDRLFGFIHLLVEFIKSFLRKQLKDEKLVTAIEKVDRFTLACSRARAAASAWVKTGGAVATAGGLTTGLVDAVLLSCCCSARLAATPVNNATPKNERRSIGTEWEKHCTNLHEHVLMLPHRLFHLHTSG